MTALVVLGLCGIFDFTLQDKNEICKYVKLNLHVKKHEEWENRERPGVLSERTCKKTEGEGDENKRLQTVYGA